MNGNRIWLPLFLAALAVAFYASGNLIAQEHHHSADHQHAMEHDQELKVGKKAEVTLREPTVIGNQLMEPGRYKVQHREEGEAHFVRIHMIGAAADTGDVICKLEPLESKAKESAVVTDTSVNPPKVVRVIVKGENAAHVF